MRIQHHAVQHGGSAQQHVEALVHAQRSRHSGDHVTVVNSVFIAVGVLLLLFLARSLEVQSADQQLECRQLHRRVRSVRTHHRGCCRAHALSRPRIRMRCALSCSQCLL
jgi:hypothetical protein